MPWETGFCTGCSGASGGDLLSLPFPAVVPGGVPVPCAAGSTCVYINLLSPSPQPPSPLGKG